MLIEYFIKNKFPILEKKKQFLLLINEQICWVAICFGVEQFNNKDYTKSSIKISFTDVKGQKKIENSTIILKVNFKFNTYYRVSKELY